MKKVIGLILIAVAVCAVAGLLARSRRTDESEEQAFEAIETAADEGVLMPEDDVPAPTIGEPA